MVNLFAVELEKKLKGFLHFTARYTVYLNVVRLSEGLGHTFVPSRAHCCEKKNG